MKSRTTIVKMVTLALLLTLVIIFQMLANVIHFGPYQPALALIPITIGSILLGPLYGSGLGLTFSIIILTSPDCAPFYAVNVAGTIITILARGLLSGSIPGLVYKLLKRFNRPIACIVSSLLTPIINTGVFITFVMIFFQGMFQSSANEAGKTVLSYLLVAMVGINFLVEFAINAGLSPAVIIITDYGFKKLNLETRDRSRNAVIASKTPSEKEENNDTPTEHN